jgi:hypothetical protein
VKERAQPKDPHVHNRRPFQKLALFVHFVLHCSFCALMDIYFR